MKLPRLKIGEEIDRRLDVISKLLNAHKQDIGFIAVSLYKTINAGGRVFIAGNGGSAGEASHFAAELVGRYKISRPSFDARSLCSDGAILTAIGNDFGFDKIFSHQLSGQFQEGDVAIFFTTSGNSANIVTALEDTGNRPIGKTILFSGNGGGKCKDLADIQLIIDSTETAIIQECHLILIHIICDLLERKFQQETDSRLLDTSAV